MWARLRRVFGSGAALPGGAAAPSGSDAAEDESLARARARAEQRFMPMEGVVSVGVGHDREGHEAIFVGVARARASIVRALPQDVDGVPIVVEEVGEMRAEGESS